MKKKKEEKMKKNPLKNVSIVLVLLFAVLFMLVQSASALPLTNGMGTHDNETQLGYYTQYEFKADELGDTWMDAFCVDGSHLNNTYDYELIAVPDSLDTVAKIADHYFASGSFGTQEQYQLAIWEILGIATADAYKGGIDPVDYILAFDWANYTMQGPVGLAHSPADQGAGGIPGGESQDFLIAVNVPEPATLMFVALSLLGIAGFGVRRKKY